MSVIAVSPFGDAFLQSGDGVWFLDLVEGSLTRQWSDTEDLQTALNTPEGQDRFLMGGLAVAAAEAGLQPGPSEILNFKIMPVLGGRFAVSNIEVADVLVAFQLTGVTHEQIKDLPDGTKISGFKIVD